MIKFLIARKLTEAAESSLRLCKDTRNRFLREIWPWPWLFYRAHYGLSSDMDIADDNKPTMTLT